MAEIAPWTIETAASTITADWLEGQLFNTAPGSEITATFVFVDDGVDADAAGRHEQLQAHVDAAREDVTIAVGMTARGEPYYWEALAGAAVDSLLVRLAPQSGSRGGVWAVLRSGSDATPAIEDGVYIWELELTVLQRDGGEDRSSIENKFAHEVSQ